MQQSRAHLLAFFGGKTKVIAITPDRIDDYIQTRLTEHALEIPVLRDGTAPGIDPLQVPGFMAPSPLAEAALARLSASWPASQLICFR
jgi:hypothetical protein